jgi:hypothetical protein
LAGHAIRRGKPSNEAMDPLGAVRAAMLSGFDVVAYHVPGTGVAEAVHHAANVAGRLAEVRYVHLCRSDPMQRIVPGAMRLAGVDVPDPSPIWFLPVLDLRSPRLGGLVLVVIGSNTDGHDRTFRNAVEAVRRDALAEGRRMPLVVRPPPTPMDTREWVGMGRNPSTPGIRAFLCRSEIPPAADDEAWSVREAELRSRLVPSHAGACRYLRDGNRMVVAYGLVSGGEPANATLAFEVGPDGWMSGLTFGGVGHDPGKHEAIVRAMWEAGPASSHKGGMFVDLDDGVAQGLPVKRFLRIALLRGDEEALALAAAHADLRSATAVSHLEDGQSILRAAEGRPRRHDFVRTWGALSSALMDPAFAEAVDAGERTLPLMAARLGVSPAVARRMQGRLRMPYHSEAVTAALRVRDLLRNRGEEPARSGGAWIAPAKPGPAAALFAEIGHDNLPALGDAGEWDALCDCAELMQAPFASWFDAVDKPRIAAGLLLRLSARDWAGRRSLADARGRAAIVDIGDYFTGVSTWIHGVLGQRLPRNDVARLLVGDRSLAQLRDASLAWHGNPALHGSGAAYGGTWPVPFDAVDLGNSWTARCLSSHAELIAEGSAGEDVDAMSGLAHCVGGYHPQCADGSSLVISLRQVRGGSAARVSTVELRRDPEGEWTFPGYEARFTLGQHRGAHNQAPPMEAARMLLALRMRLAGGSVPFDPAAFEDRAAVFRTADTRWAEEALPAFVQFLPKPWRGLDAGAFRARLAEVFEIPRPEQHHQGDLP